MAKHIPLRMCVGCRQMLPKQDLIKIVKVDGVPVVDSRQKLFGRGTYLCKTAACLQQAQKRRALERALQMQVPEAFYEELGGMIDG